MSVVAERRGRTPTFAVVGLVLTAGITESVGALRATRARADTRGPSDEGQQ